MALAGLGLIIGSAFGILIWAVLALHAQDLQTQARLCSFERADRMIDQAIVTHTGIHLVIPALPHDCH